MSEQKRPGMYALLIWIVIVLAVMGMVWGPTIGTVHESIKRIEAMQPCSQVKP